MADTSENRNVTRQEQIEAGARGDIERWKRLVCGGSEADYKRARELKAAREVFWETMEDQELAARRRAYWSGVTEDDMAGMCSRHRDCVAMQEIEGSSFTDEQLREIDRRHREGWLGWEMRDAIRKKAAAYAAQGKAGDG